MRTHDGNGHDDIYSIYVGTGYYFCVFEMS